MADEIETEIEPVDQPATLDAEPAETEVDRSSAPEKPAQLQQWTRHYVKKLEAECLQLQGAMNQAGFTLNIAALMDAGKAHAALKLLVAKGLATEDEVNGETLLFVRAKLMGGLQSAEVRRLQEAQQGRGLAVARKPGIIVAKH